MANYNRVILCGRIGKDPDVRVLGEKKVASFSLATSEKYGDREYTEWHNIVAWSPMAEVIERYTHKGDEILVEGKIRSREYTDRDNVTRRAYEILADRVQLIGGGRRREDAQAAPAAPAAAPSQGRMFDDMPEDL